MKIRGARAREILDSRGNPTIEVDLETTRGVYRASVPSGASTGAHEALELRDGGARYRGKGVSKAVRNARLLARLARGKDFSTQRAFDDFLLKKDGTPNKKRYGANALLGLSLAFARATAGRKPLYAHLSKTTHSKPTLPLPFANVLNGGKHAGNALRVQEFMIVPSGARTFTEATRMVCEVYHALKKEAVRRFGSQAGNVGDEGGIAPPLSNSKQALELVWGAVEEAGYSRKMRLALDCAASGFYEKNVYFVDGKYRTSRELMEYYLDLFSTYPIISIEDPFHEEAFYEFAALTRVLKGKAQVVGDDLLVTNPSRIRRAENACTALLLKTNQIGTLSEAFDAAALSRSFGWNVMVSHRSGETEDAFISHLAAGLGCGQIKLGAPCRGERTAKYNELLRIEEDGLRLARFKLP